MASNNISEEEKKRFLFLFRSMFTRLPTTAASFSERPTQKNNLFTENKTELNTCGSKNLGLRRDFNDLWNEYCVQRVREGQ